MSVYVDDAYLPYGRMKMCHMMADDLTELHDMARKLGLKRLWFQQENYPHYDIGKGKRILAVSLGAKEITSREMVKAFRHQRKLV